MNELDLCNYWTKHYKDLLGRADNLYSVFSAGIYKRELKYWQTRKLKTVLEKQYE